MAFPDTVASGELIESAWGNSVVNHLPAYLGHATGLSYGNVPADGVNREIRSWAFTAAPVAGQVVVLWNFQYGGAQANGRINPKMQSGGVDIGAANQSFLANDFGTITFYGTVAAAAGAAVTVSFQMALFGAGSNLNVAGDAIAYLIPAP